LGLEKVGADVTIYVFGESARRLFQEENGNLEFVAAELDAGENGSFAGKTTFVCIGDFFAESELRDVGTEAVGVQEHALEAGIEHQPNVLALNRKRDGEGLRRFFSGYEGVRCVPEGEDVESVVDEERGGGTKGIAADDAVNARGKFAELSEVADDDWQIANGERTELEVGDGGRVDLDGMVEIEDLGFVKGEKKPGGDLRVDNGLGGACVEDEMQSREKADAAFDGDEKSVAELEGQRGIESGSGAGIGSSLTLSRMGLRKRCCEYCENEDGRHEFHGAPLGRSRGGAKLGQRDRYLNSPGGSFVD